jgi:cell division protein FtsI (penicillin-binding protein 3)
MFSNLFNLKFQWHASSKHATPRMHFVILIFLSAFITINVKLLQVSTNQHFTHTKIQEQSIARRDIVDRNGTLVATSIPIYSLFANPNKMLNKKQAIEKLSKVIKISNQTKLLTELNSEKNFVWIKRNLTPKHEESINSLGIPGIGFEKSFKRIYSYNNLLSHVIGYVSLDNKGLAGVERFFDDELLKSENLEVDNKLKLTIDVRIQNILNEELDHAIKEFGAIGGTGVVVDPNTGEILALVSKPDFDPHNPGQAKSEQIFNKTSLGSYEFGSVFKILTVAIGLDTKKIGINNLYDISHLKVGKFNIQDFHNSHGLHTVAQIFAKSSNKGTAKIALDIGQKSFRQYLKKLKLDDQVITEIPEKNIPILSLDKQWSDISMATISYGYGVATSVLNLVQAIIPTINGGTLYPLTLIKKDIKSSGVKVFSSNTSEDIKKLLRLVVTDGTGKKANVDGYMVGGKSGTVNKLNGKYYAKNSRMSSFISIFPSNSPKYLIYVMLDEPKPTSSTSGLATGGATAAPTVGKIISRIISLTGMLPCDIDNPEAEKQIIISKNGV